MKQKELSNILLALSLMVAAMSTLPANEPTIPVKDGDKIAFLGDSITQAGFRNPAGYGNLVILGFDSAGLHVTPIPAGVGGNASPDMLGRIDADVIAKKPDWVTISCGVNDVYKSVELESFKTNLKTMVEKCQAAGIKVILLTPTMFGEDPANKENQKLAANVDFVRQLAEEKHCLLADLNSLMQTEMKRFVGVPLEPGQRFRLTVDGLHMNPEGDQMMASGILRACGLTEAQVQSAREKWQDISKAADVATVSVTLRQLTALKALAKKRHQSVTDLVNAATAKSVENLLEEKE